MPFYKLLMLSTVLFSSVALSNSGVMYKYVDENGDQIISSTLPSDAANRGYTVVSSRGNIIEVVKPKLSDDEIAAIEKKRQLEIKEKERLTQEKIMQEKQARKDTLLLKMFSSAQDIERSRDDKVQNIDVQLSITKENLARLQDQLNQAESTKAKHESLSQPIPLQLNETIEDTKIQINDNKVFLQRKEEEKQLIKTQYQEMLERFKKVKHPYHNQSSQPETE